MALKYGIFESEFLGLDTNNMPIYDRAVDEGFLEMYCGGFFTDGIALFVEDCFQVISELENKITVKPGLAMLKGKMAYDQLDYTEDLPTSPTASSRYDRVVLRRDNVAREIKIMFLSGAENAAPVAPALVRTENVHDLSLATILRSPGDTVTQAKITDDRLNTSLCGVIAPKTNVLDTEALFSQFTSIFNEWFNGPRDKLTTDAAGNLLALINRNATFQTAGGTGTAITLTGVELIDGFQTTFVILASNSGAATTINTKPLYKPGTTIAPKLVAGKAATVWYNTAGDCFFIKASAEGDATAANVLAGKTFSNDDDTGLIGTMVDRGAVTITPGTANQAIINGYHNGSGYVAGDTDLIPSNILSGKNIFGVNGNVYEPNTIAGDTLIIVPFPTAAETGGLWTPFAQSAVASTTYTKYGPRITMRASGTVRISFDLSPVLVNYKGLVYARIYKNGIAAGLQRSTISGAPSALSFVEDFTVNKDDFFEFYLKTSGDAGAQSNVYRVGLGFTRSALIDVY